VPNGHAHYVVKAGYSAEQNAKLLLHMVPRMSDFAESKQVRL
jgi:hypothetical protein